MTKHSGGVGTMLLEDLQPFYDSDQVPVAETSIEEHYHPINFRGSYVRGTLLESSVRRGRNYRTIMQDGEQFRFGKEGSGDGELCRPWGICCDKTGRIIVADRSNNRIQIFNPDGGYLMKFGNGGTGAGQFDRPAGVCVNSLDQIIVADKDNHRIQVFANDGTFAFMFGERGRPTSMFNYPWGVAVDSKDQIAVSDTRNHRVQIFSPTGQYLYKCGFDTAYFYKHLDSPRGVCFMPDGRLLISDFNNHRLVMMTDSQHAEAAMKCFGGEGDVSGMFCRPQGLTLDHEGNLLVCDSRNNRIQVFELHEMKTIAVIGSKSSIDGSRIRGHSQIVLSSPSGHRSDVLFASTPRAERGRRTENPFSNVVLSPIMLDSLRISESALSQWTKTPRQNIAKNIGSAFYTPPSATRIAGSPSPMSRHHRQSTAAQLYYSEGMKTPTMARHPALQSLFATPSDIHRDSPASCSRSSPGSPKPDENHLDRPTDLCVGLDGRIYVVDFGNNCIRVY